MVFSPFLLLVIVASTLSFLVLVAAEGVPSCGQTCNNQPPDCSSNRNFLACTCNTNKLEFGCSLQNCKVGVDESAANTGYPCYCTPGFTKMCYDSGCTDYSFSYMDNNGMSNAEYYDNYGSHNGNNYGSSNSYETKAYCNVGMCAPRPPPCRIGSDPLTDHKPCTCEPDASPAGCRMRPCESGDNYDPTNTLNHFKCICAASINIGCWNDKCSDSYRGKDFPA